MVAPSCHSDCLPLCPQQCTLCHLWEPTLTLLSPHLSTSPHAPQGRGVMKVLQYALVLKACCLDQPHLPALGADQQASRSACLQNSWMHQNLQGKLDFKHSLEVTSVLILVVLIDSAPFPHRTDFLWSSAPACWTILLHWKREPSPGTVPSLCLGS